MANSDPLHALRDIHLPLDIGWWPLAPGWYVLIALTFIVCVAICYWVYCWRNHGLAKREALVILDKYRQNYEKAGVGTQQTTAYIAELLKRVALAYYPRNAVAGLHGQAWIDFLNKTGKNNLDFTPVSVMLLELPFKADQPINIKPLFTRAALWIKQRGVPCLH